MAKSPTLKGEIQHFKNTNFFTFLWVIFVLLDPDPANQNLKKPGIFQPLMILHSANWTLQKM